ncbi:kinase-like protein [Lentithecium fluviatile CBS 122367]|uniref:Kinase-like protein n=1 Tax=Lentithecium fluviatile CBS 122367 TaxID=1168545 RepID=A0A6G1ILG1_9PLEO|nr:kinase-like protein [Lentithecium fluviatile CBS 122367]
MLQTASFDGEIGSPIQNSNPVLSIEEGRDYILDNDTQLPLDLEKVLGTGYTSIVEKVRHRNSKKAFAKKRLPFLGPFLQTQTEEQFSNEVKVIRKLASHPHIIRVFATYITKSEFGMILEPVAQTNLGDFLEHYKKSMHRGASTATHTLERSFGCLANGLSYMQQKSIWHNDIRPPNILVCGASVIYADFGGATVGNTASESTTEERPDFLIGTYSPPEVFSHGKKSDAGDVFSLGCVFVEILSALCSTITYDQSQPFKDIIEKVHKDLCSASLPSKLSSLPNFIIPMTLLDGSKRAKADQVSSGICANADLCCKLCGSSREAKDSQEA